MKNIVPIIVSVILMVLVGCNSENNSVENDLTKENLKGDVIVVISDENGYNSVFYDENGLIKKVQNGISIEQEFSSIRDYYYSNGKLDFIELKSNGYTEKVIYFYDLSGVLISTKSTLSFITGESFEGMDFHYKYDIIGNMILDSFNTNIWHKYYFTDNKIDSCIDNLKKIITIYSNGIPLKGMPYEATDNGNRNIKYSITYEYMYDAQGNWTQQKSLIDGKEDKVINRIIIYKGQDISKYEKKYSDYVSSLNSSSDNNSQTESNDNSSSNSYQQPERQQQQPEKAKCYPCRSSGNCNECGKTFRVHTYDGYGWKDRNETRLGYVMCSTCRGAGVFYKKNTTTNKWEIEKECYVSSCNNGWVYCKKCNSYGNGKLLGKCAECKGTGYRN